MDTSTGTDTVSDTDTNNSTTNQTDPLGPHRSNPNRPLNTNNQLYESVATVRIDYTTAPNDTVRLTIEHAEHDGGVRTFLVYEPQNVSHRLGKHLINSIQTDLVDVEIVDTVGLDLAVSDLIDALAESQPHTQAGEIRTDDATADA